MALEISNPYQLINKSTESKSFSKPRDVLKDSHLTHYQKSVILESMLSEVRDEIDAPPSRTWSLFARSPAQQEADILKAQSILKSQMT